MRVTVGLVGLEEEVDFIVEGADVVLGLGALEILDT